MIDLKGKRILVIDDELSIRDLIINELEANGAECVEAANAADGLSYYKNQHFDVVVSDIRMPDGDGLQFMTQIRSANLPRRPIIFMSAFLDIPRREIYDLGVETIIDKPFKLSQLLELIKTALESPRSTWRKSPRALAYFDLNVEIPSINKPVSAKSYNISKQGMFVHLTDVFPKVNDLVPFKMTMSVSENETKTYQGTLLVHWIREKGSKNLLPGFGGEFRDLSEQTIEEIFNFAN